MNDITNLPGVNVSVVRHVTPDNTLWAIQPGSNADHLLVERSGWSNVAIDGSNEVSLPDWHPSYDEYEAYRQKHPELNLPEQKKPADPPDETEDKRNPNSGAVAKHVPTTRTTTALRSNGTMGRIYVMPMSPNYADLLRVKTKDEWLDEQKYHEEAKARADAEGDRISNELDKARRALDDTSVWNRSQGEQRAQLKDQIKRLEAQLSARGEDALYARAQSVRAFDQANPELANQPKMSPSPSNTERHRLNERMEAQLKNEARFNAALQSPFAMVGAGLTEHAGGDAKSMGDMAKAFDGLMGAFGGPKSPGNLGGQRREVATQPASNTGITPSSPTRSSPPPPKPVNGHATHEQPSRTDTQGNQRTDGAAILSARYVYDARSGRYRDRSSGRYVAAKDLPWPDNAGFASSTTQQVPPGTILDRYGSDTGRFMGEPGTTVSQRGMAQGTDAMPYTQYRVLKPFDAQVGPAAAVPAFGASGGAMQYLPGRTIKQLVADR